MENCKCFFLHPGGIFISEDYYHIHTVLGSCISVCLWDQKTGISAMNHFVFSHYQKGTCNGKFGDLSLPYMLNEMKKRGASNMKAHIVGGSHNLNLSHAVGDQNIVIADDFLHKNRIPVDVRDVGGSISRKIVFDTHSGAIQIVQGK